MTSWLPRAWLGQHAAHGKRVAKPEEAASPPLSRWLEAQVAGDCLWDLGHILSLSCFLHEVGGGDDRGQWAIFKAPLFILSVSQSTFLEAIRGPNLESVQSCLVQSIMAQPGREQFVS